MAKIIVNNPRQVINGGAKKYYFKVKGLGGPKGDQGVKGDPGSRGPQGLPGNAATVYVGSTTTLPVGQDATVENVGTQYNAVLNFGIPQGPRGPQGIRGERGEPGQTGQPGPRGPQGEKGTNATVYIGTTSTLNPGTQATVYNSGTDSNAVLNFGIPRGETGATGATGATGPAGQNFTPTIVDSLPATGNQSNLYLTPKNYTTGTATGNPITISIGEDAGQVTSAQLDGNTTQQAYTGKNFINSNIPPVTPSARTTISQVDNGIEVVRKNTSQTGAGYAIVPIQNIDRLLGQVVSYSFNVDGDRASDAMALYGYINGGVSNTRIRGFSNTSGSFTMPASLPKGEDGYCLCFYVETGEDKKATFTNMQLELGSTVSSYEPYVGGTASPNPDYPQAVNTVTGLQKVDVSGKNLLNQGAYTSSSTRGASVTFNQDKIVVSGTVDSKHYPSWIMYADGSTATSDWWATASLVNTSKGQFTDSGTYTISIEADGNIGSTDGDIGSIATAFEFIVGYMDGTISTNQYVDRTTKKATFTTSKPINYISFGFRPTVSYDATFTIQLEAGDTATSFAPYNKQTLPIDLGSIELCKIGDYQDYIYKSGGKWYVRKECGKLVVNGSETGWIITESTGSPNYYYARTNAKDGISVSNYYGGYCNNFTNRGIYIQSSDAVNADVFSLGSPSYSLRMLILGSRLSAMTTEALSTWLAANTPTIYYALATPTDTTITDQTLIAQLEAIRTAALWNGANTISNVATGTNLAGDLELGYYEYDPHNRYNKWLWLDINNNYEQLGS